MPLSTKICIIDADEVYTLKVEDGIAKTCTCSLFSKTNCICQHILVAGEKLQCLKKLFLWLRGQRKSSAMFMKAAQKNSGRKPGQGKRKGKNNIASKPIDEEIDPDLQIDQPIQYQYQQFYQSDEPFKV
jgi:hypothetical protein